MYGVIRKSFRILSATGNFTVPVASRENILDSAVTGAAPIVIFDLVLDQSLLRSPAIVCVLLADN